MDKYNCPKCKDYWSQLAKGYWRKLLQDEDFKYIKLYCPSCSLPREERRW